MKVKQFIKRVFLVEILKGMALTIRTMFTKAVTRQYPEEKREAMLGFRGLHALAKDSHGNIKCVGCGLCVAICPSKCITVVTSSGVRYERVVDNYEIDTLKCLFCALCVEACPYGAIVLTRHYEYSGYNKEDFYMTKEKLLENYDKYMGEEEARVYFERFWGPRIDDFSTPEHQAVFKGVKRDDDR